MTRTTRSASSDDLAAVQPRSGCPVACALDIVGDRWTLLVVRDLLRGKKRFGELVASSEHIPTNILAERLKRLERAGLVAAVPYSEHPPRHEYALTAAGRDLAPVLSAVATWGRARFPHTRGPRPPSLGERTETSAGGAAQRA
jgi:DNA-binding HxlR family transcriptional regulator